MSDDIARDELVVDKPGAEDVRLYSVTTILKAASGNEGLVYWAAEETAKAAVSSMKTLHAIIEEQGEDAAVEWLKGARFRAPKGQRTATELGSAVHAWCEEYALTGQRPPCDDELKPFCDQFDKWAQDFQPEYLAAEMTVFHPDYGYAGTLDAVLALQKVPLVTDYKVSRKTKTGAGKDTTPFPTVAEQLAAYRNAQFAAAWRPRRFEVFRRRYYALGPDERALAVPVPNVEGGLCIHITPEWCRAFPVACGPEIFEAFCYSIEAARWDIETSKRVFGEPLVPVAA